MLNIDQIQFCTHAKSCSTDAGAKHLIALFAVVDEVDRLPASLPTLLCAQQYCNLASPCNTDFISPER